MPQLPRTEIPFWGIDSRPEARPGVPMEKDPPRHAETAHWNKPEQQPKPDFPIFKRVGLEELTPVFGTAQPPHGLSGLLRKLAYSLPEHAPTHWAVMLLADRVDAVESRFGFAKLFALVGLGYAVASMVSSYERRRAA